MSHITLKINRMSLAAEAVIIRKEEARLLRLERRRRKAHARALEGSLGLAKILGLEAFKPNEEERQSIHNHRVVEVRREARVKHLAAMFMRYRAACDFNDRENARGGLRKMALVTYRDVENVAYSLPCGWAEVAVRTSQGTATRRQFLSYSWEPVLDAVRRFGGDTPDLAQRFSAWTGGVGQAEVNMTLYKRGTKAHVWSRTARPHRSKEEWEAMLERGDGKVEAAQEVHGLGLA